MSMIDVIQQKELGEYFLSFLDVQSKHKLSQVSKSCRDKIKFKGAEVMKVSILDAQAEFEAESKQLEKKLHVIEKWSTPKRILLETVFLIKDLVKFLLLVSILPAGMFAFSVAIAPASLSLYFILISPGPVGLMIGAFMGSVMFIDAYEDLNNRNMFERKSLESALKGIHMSRISQIKQYKKIESLDVDEATLREKMKESRAIQQKKLSPGRLFMELI